MLRLLIVDDSPTARQILTEIFNSDPGIEVIGQAKNGREAVELAQKLAPDVISMDMYMPVMDGFEATREIMTVRPTPIVVVSASTAVHETQTAMHMLQAGALVVRLKPPGPSSPDFDQAARDLIDTIKAMADVKIVHRPRRTPSAEPAGPTLQEKASTACRVIAIAASTGGPPALSCLLGGLPSNFPLPILLVQHIASGFVEGFASWLNSVVPMAVKLAEDGARLKPGTVYVAPQDRHLGVTRSGRVRLSDDPPIDGFRPAGTHLFSSVAEAFASQVVALILTGMGRDGVTGLRAVHRAGGLTIAQDEQSCVVFGMPGAAVAEGLAHAVLPIQDMAPQLLQLVMPGNASNLSSALGPQLASWAEVSEARSRTR